MAGLVVVPPIFAELPAEAPDHIRLIVEAIPDAIAIVDRAGIIADVNRHMVVLAGRSRADLLGAELSRCFTEEDLAAACIRKAFTDGSVTDFELTFRPRGGPHTVVACDASTLQSGSAEPDRVLVVARDTSAQAHSAALAALVQSADDAIVGKTVDGVITSWNSGAERLYGFSLKEVLGRQFEMFIPENDRPAESIMLRRVAAGERVEPFEAARLRKDGSPVTVSVSISSIMDALGNIVGVATMSRDLSAQRLAETKLRWMLEVAPDAILGVDASGSVELVNAQCQALFGYHREELMGQPVEMLIPDGLRPVDAGQVGAGQEVVTLHKNGTEIPVEVSLRGRLINVFCGVM